MQYVDFYDILKQREDVNLKDFIIAFEINSIIVREAVSEQQDHTIMVARVKLDDPEVFAQAIMFIEKTPNNTINNIRKTGEKSQYFVTNTSNIVPYKDRWIFFGIIHCPEIKVKPKHQKVFWDLFVH